MSATLFRYFSCVNYDECTGISCDKFGSAVNETTFTVEENNQIYLAIKLRYINAANFVNAYKLLYNKNT